MKLNKFLLGFCNGYGKILLVIFCFLIQTNNCRANYNSVFLINNFNITSLMNAAYQDDAKAANVFLRSGANINEKNSAGVSALHVAAKNNSVSVAKVLVEYNANLNIYDNEWWTPLMRACLNKNPKIVRLLVENGANIWLKNYFNESALMHAVMSDCVECIEILKDNFKSPDYDANSAIIEINKSLNIVYKKENKEIEKLLDEFYDDVVRYENNLNDREDEKDKKKKKSRKDRKIEEEREKERLRNQEKENDRQRAKTDIKDELDYITRIIYVFRGETKYYSEKDKLKME